MWNRELLTSKTRALLVHIGIGAIFLVPLLLLIRFRWFPPPFFYTDGGWQGLRILLACDLVLGPALTFLIFNPAKSRLALGVDFAFIGVVQLAALVYGGLSIEQSRVRAVAYTDGAFYAVPNGQFVKQGITAEQWAPLGEGPQTWVFLRDVRPEEMHTYQDAINHQLLGEALFWRYQPLSGNQEQLGREKVKIERLTARLPKVEEQHRQFVEKHGGDAAALSFYPLYGSYRNVLVALDPQLRFVGYIDVDLNHLKE